MPRDIHYYLDRGITSWNAIEQLEEAYYAGLSPKPVAAINYLRDGKKLKQFLARQQGLIDGMKALREIKEKKVEIRLEGNRLNHDPCKGLLEAMRKRGAPGG